jgi:hypothetical protein
MNGVMPDIMAGAAGCGVFGVLAVLAFAVGFGLLGAVIYAVLTRRAGSRGPNGAGQDRAPSAATSAPTPA